jgi:SAM-dependent methyltransferase
MGIARVDGCDLVQAAVDTVRQETLDARAVGEYEVADLSKPGSVGTRTYPLVSCFNVLLHVVDDDSFKVALANVASLVEPGGVLLLAEPILLDASQALPYDVHRSSTARPLAAYRDPLVATGLELVTIEHATVLANNPIEAGSPSARARFERWWRFAQARDRAGARWIGPLAAAADRAAMLTGSAPTTKFALFRRPPGR